MLIKEIHIRNYRLLKDVKLSLNDRTTLIVGRNNSGKTSLTEIFRSFLSGTNPKVKFEDFNLSSLNNFRKAFAALTDGKPDEDIRNLLPKIELELLVDYKADVDGYGLLGDFILDLDEDIYKTRIIASFRLGDGKIKSFFEGLDGSSDVSFFKDLKGRIISYYEACVFAIDPTDETNKTRLDFVKFKRLLLTSFINAQRGLDDETHNEKDVLGKTLGNIFKSSSLANAPAEFKTKSDEINSVVEELQKKVDSDFQTKVGELLPTLTIFGYPGLQDPNLSATTELNVKSLLESNTRVHYKKGEYFSLPETYNGLGARNLIYILFQIYEFFRNYQSVEQEAKGHLIFIEEPEAHLHPQMQEVFIKQLNHIVTEFEKLFNSGTKWPVQFVVSTHSTHIANEADFDTIRYFMSKMENETTVKDLGKTFEPEEHKKDKEFIHKYLTLTKSDLYFADKAIMVEGTTERILLPEIIRKVDGSKSTELRRSYLSVVEIGGAYAHHFYKFLDFLELKTLVVTDLDCVKKEISAKSGKIVYSSCPFSEGTHSSNGGLSEWFDETGYSSLANLTVKTDTDKVKGFRRLTFEIPEEGLTACGRSFEDAFILANRELFGLENETDEKQAEKDAFEKAEKIGEKSKANFAIEYAIEKTNWKVPKYIEDGLLWLAANDIKKEASQKEISSDLS
ncbi:MAG: ATP-dependent endonuclease [Methylobacter sp.]|nr:ATP-dependent endonuclease [Methylobacter sp.]